jgi:LCP family protein required for cell wall assembly
MGLDPGRTGKRHYPLPIWVIRALAVAFGLAALLSGLLVYTAMRDMVAAWTGTGLNPFRPAGGSTREVTAAPGATPTVVTLGEAPVPWNGTDRVTILLMGLDYRDWESDNGPPRTDTMMLVTIDPVSRTAGMLSIPRDLWVEIPGGFEHNRINTAYFLGESFNLPGGGPGLAMKTVENLLGVPIEYYAVIEFSAFERMIDEIGGIELLVPERIKISPIGRLSLWLEPKGYVLDGAEALAYARARKTEGGDFDRAQRQQQVAFAIREQLLELDMVPTLIAKAPKLYQELAAGIRTNLSLEQMIALGLLAMQVPPENIRRGVIGPPEMVLLETLPGGAEVLKPIPDKIRILRDEIFTATGAIGPSIDIEDPAEAARQENARLAVRNGAGVEGLASRTTEFLQEQGLNVVEVAGSEYDLDLLDNVDLEYTPVGAVGRSYGVSFFAGFGLGGTGGVIAGALVDRWDTQAAFLGLSAFMAVTLLLSIAIWLMARQRPPGMQPEMATGDG